MQLDLVGLGRTGAKISRRLIRADRFGGQVEPTKK